MRPKEARVFEREGGDWWKGQMKRRKFSRLSILIFPQISQKWIHIESCLFGWFKAQQSDRRILCVNYFPFFITVLFVTYHNFIIINGYIIKVMNT